MRLPVAREGWPFILAPAVAALGLAVAGRRRLALPFAVAAGAALAFFRDPDRTPPAASTRSLAGCSRRPTGG